MPYSREQISEARGRNWSPTSTTVPYPGNPPFRGVSPLRFATLLVCLALSRRQVNLHRRGRQPLRGRAPAPASRRAPTRPPRHPESEHRGLSTSTSGTSTDAENGDVAAGTDRGSVDQVSCRRPDSG